MKRSSLIVIVILCLGGIPWTGAEAQPSELVFVARNVVDISKQVQSQGRIHSNHNITFKPGGPSAHTGDLSAVNRVIIQTDNSIEGDVTAGDKIKLVGTANITGTANDFTRVRPMSLPSFSFGAGTDNVTVPENGEETLPPGSYKNVEVLENGTLNLSSGTYYMQSLNTHWYTTLDIDVSGGPVTVNVVGNLNFGNRSEVTISPGGETATSQLTFNRMDIGATNIRSRAKAMGTINVPDGSVVLHKNSRFKGVVYAKKIKVHPGATFSPHEVDINDITKPSSLDGGEAVLSGLPTSFALAQNYPNPFNPSTTIAFSVPRAGEVTLSIYNLRGQLVQTLVSGAMAAGQHRVVWDGTDARGARVSSGVYVYQLKANDFVATRKLVLTK